MTTHSSPSASNTFVATDFQGVGSQFSDIYVAGAYDGLTSTSARGLSKLYGESNVLCENLWGMWVDYRNNTQSAVGYTFNLYRYFDTTISNITTIHGNVGVQSFRCTINNIKFGGSAFVPQGTTFATKYRKTIIIQLGEKNKHIGGSLIETSLPPYYGMNSSNLLSVGNEWYEYNLVNRNYDSLMTSNSYFYNTYSDGDIVKNCICDISMYPASMQVDAYKLTMDNVRGMARNGGAFRKDSTVNMVSGSAGNFTNALGASIFSRQDPLALPNEGYVATWFSPPINDGDYEYSFTGQTSYFNNLKNLYLEGGAEVVLSNKAPIKGVTAFRDALALEGGGLDTIAEVKLEAEIVKASQSFTGNYTELVWDGGQRNFYTTLQSMLDNLVGYNSNLGFNMRVRFTNISTSLNTLVYWDFPCELDTNYKASDAFVIIEGGSSIDQYEMRRKSDTSVLFSWEGVGRYDFPVGNLVGEEVYFVRYVFSDGTYDRAASNKPYPIALQYGSNGIVKLYVGDEVQVASTDPSNIWNYETRTLTEGFTTSDRDQLNKALTTGKFLALK